MTAESNVTDRHAGAMALVRRLRALLDDEFEALKAQDLEWFERMQPLKLELLQSLGSAVPPDSTATAGDAAQVALQMRQWDDFVAVMNECREAHRRNDVLIRTRLDAIRAALAVLQNGDSAQGGDLYDRRGRISSAFGPGGYADAAGQAAGAERGCQPEAEQGAEQRRPLGLARLTAQAADRQCRGASGERQGSGREHLRQRAHFSLANARSAASRVISSSAAPCAIEVKPASKALGAR